LNRESSDAKLPARQGTAIFLASSFVAQACALIRYVVLARLLGPEQLGWSATLILTAQAWSQHLAQAGALSHRNPLSDGAPAGWRKLGENVGYGSSVDVVQGAFMNSPGHRANILDRTFNNVGIGVTVDGNGRRWVVQEFATL